ncbi:MAG TPA: endonuclease domain-containing protein, partial [Candidatus Acidoferrales bacterium]|nr:endonuclease domain-containing protein [Candidatus Acidoferrales bacterium]
IADLCCVERRLVVELDGGQHSEQIEADRKRSAFMTNRGFRVLRFWNDQVLSEMEGVLEQILAALGEGPQSGSSRAQNT